LKLAAGPERCELAAVAPHAGAWIETCGRSGAVRAGGVAPHAGAWIETPGPLPLLSALSVAPHAGAWIETCRVEGTRQPSGRPPRGGVD
jgi:hypothetical protein